MLASALVHLHFLVLIIQQFLQLYFIYGFKDSLNSTWGKNLNKGNQNVL